MEPRNDLTDRERLVIKWAADGHIDKQIARRMGVSLSTVRTYWDRIHEKTGTVNKTHAVCVALGYSPTPEGDSRSEQFT